MSSNQSESEWMIITYIALSVNIVFIMIAVFLIIYNLCSNSKEMIIYIQRRSKSIHYKLNISLTITIISWNLLDINFSYYNNEILGIITIFSSVISAFYIVYILFIKNWMLFYKFKWTFYTMQYQWIHIINSQLSQNKEYKENWFIKNNHKYGNLKYISKLFGIIYVIYTFITAILYAIASNSNIDTITIPRLIASIFQLITLPIIGGLYYYLVRKTPKNNFGNDKYFIHSECKIHSKLLLLAVLSTVIGTILWNIINDGKQYEIVVLSNLFTNLCLFLMIYISTMYLYNKYVQENKVQFLQLIDHKNIIEFENDILCSENALNALMMLLSREYAMEILLSFIEFHQYQLYIMNKLEMNKEEIQHSFNINLNELPSNIPDSEILLSCPDNEKLMAYKLYKKYIEIGSEYQINIASNTKERLESQLSDRNKDLFINDSNISLKDLLLLYQPCKEEMRIYLHEMSLLIDIENNKQNDIGLTTVCIN